LPTAVPFSVASCLFAGIFGCDRRPCRDRFCLSPDCLLSVDAFAQ
jgi:hypothetical protein